MKRASGLFVLIAVLVGAPSPVVADVTTPPCSLAAIVGEYGVQCEGFLNVGAGLEPITMLGTGTGGADGIFEGFATMNSSLGSVRTHVRGPATVSAGCFGHVDYTTNEILLPGGGVIAMPPASFDFAVIDGGREILGAGVVPFGASGDVVPRMTCRLVKRENAACVPAATTWGLQCRGFTNVGAGLEPFSGVGTVSGDETGHLEGYSTINSSQGSLTMFVSGDQTVGPDCFGHVDYTAVGVLPGGVTVPLPAIGIDFVIIKGGQEMFGAAVAPPGVTGDAVPRQVCHLVRLSPAGSATLRLRTESTTGTPLAGEFVMTEPASGAFASPAAIAIADQERFTLTAPAAIGACTFWRMVDPATGQATPSRVIRGTTTKDVERVAHYRCP